MNIMEVHDDLQSHKKDDMAFHSEVIEIKGDIKSIKENHLAHIQASMTELQTNMAWLLKFFWIAVPTILGMLIKLVFFK